MEQTSATTQGSESSQAPRTSSSSGHRRNPSGTGLLSRIPFMRGTSDHLSRGHDGDDTNQHLATRDSLPSVVQQQQQKTRRRRGSLRKVALLGRGAQRERRESRSGSLSIDTRHAGMILDGIGPTSSPSAVADVHTNNSPNDTKTDHDAFGLGISDVTPRPSMDGYASRNAAVQIQAVQQPISIPARQKQSDSEPAATSPTISYSTTDDEDLLHIGGRSTAPTRPELRPTLLSSGSESYFVPSLPSRPTLQRRRSTTVQHAKSPLALTNLTTPVSATALDGDWDYAETEWWGWVVLAVTWFVFVTGMGSCLGIWSWAWDVGTTPYAPPELEDDPTLPIVGYYPALILLTCVMAWVWVVAAWVGMKYFRHAKISGD